MKLMLLIVLALMPSLSFAVPAPRGASSTDLICPGDKFIKGGDPNPWPFGLEDVFPWMSVDGVWAPIEGKCDSLFSLKVRTMEDGKQVVQIHQIDPVQCRRQGIGVGAEKNRIVQAAMTNLQGVSFDVTLRAFNEQVLHPYKHSSPRSIPPMNQNVLVLTMYPKGDWQRRKSYELQKIAEVPQMICYKNRSHQ